MTTELAPQATARARPPRGRVRADLLAAARATFFERGYGASSVTTIAAAAGYTKGAVYSNFGGKEELFAEVCRAEFADTSQRLLTELLASSGTAERRGGVRSGELSDEAADRLAALVTTQGELQAAVGEFRTLAHHSGEASAIYAALRRNQIDLLTAEFARHGFLGADPDPNAHREAAVLLLVTINAFAMEHRAAPATFPPRLLVSTLARLIRGLLP